jgi:hypothetical protein
MGVNVSRATQVSILIVETWLQGQTAQAAMTGAIADSGFANHSIAEGKARVRAIEALGTIEPSGPSERDWHSRC